LHRLRVFAGPNGSGKSSLFDEFSKKYPTGIFVNADNIERELKTKGYIDLNDFGLNLSNADLKSFFKTKNAKSLLSKVISAESNEFKIEISKNIIVSKGSSPNSYLGALVAAFIRSFLLKNKISFSFETVMSHSSKIADLQHAKDIGFKTYLYFICTDDPIFNKSRVENRVRKGGHPVDSEKIKSRYFKSLENVMPAIDFSDRVYFFDNSGLEFERIAEVQNGQLVINVEPTNLPNWFIEYVLKYFV